jgi:hypothetical protein
MIGYTGSACDRILVFVYFNIPKGTYETKTRASSLNLRDDNLRKNEGLLAKLL